VTARVTATGLGGGHELLGLPPSVTIELDGDLQVYWRLRARQALVDSYAGIHMMKFPEDLRTYEHLLWLDRPNVVVEVGTHHGGSALWFRDRLSALASYGRIESPVVVSIDVDQTRAREALGGVDPDYERTIVLLEADVRDPELHSLLAEVLPKSARCLVVEDSAHDYETTFASLAALSGFVPSGGFFVVEDGCVDVEAMRVDPNWPRGVLPALADWLRTEAGEAFDVRRDLELYGISSHPMGFLRRVR
jgi:cephalosporin hydroxylase